MMQSCGCDEICKCSASRVWERERGKARENKIKANAFVGESAESINLHIFRCEREKKVEVGQMKN